MSVYASQTPTFVPGESDFATYDFEKQQAMLDKLERRLEDGYRRIELGIAQGLNVDRWEEFWLDLLREYEQLVDAFVASQQFAAAA